jgi:APA family basic amino acid/polyamine antiporter
MWVTPSSEEASANAALTHDLPRALNLPQALSIVIGTVVGSAVFLVPYEMTRAAGSFMLVNLAWIIGGLLSLAGAMTYAELGAMRPFAGGEYVYLRDAYGERTAFIYMWTWFAIAKPASIASVTSGLALTLAQFSAFAFLDHAIPHTPILWAQLLAIAATWLITGLNCLGIRKAGDFQLAFTAFKVLLILAVIALCFTLRPVTQPPSAPHAVTIQANNAARHRRAEPNRARAGTTTHPAQSSGAGPTAGGAGGAGGFMVALIAALWAYDGWNDLNMVGGEVRSPRRNLPIALVGGTGAVILLYLGVSAALEHLLPLHVIASSPRPAMVALALISRPWTQTVLTVGMAIGILVGLNGTIMSGARVPYAAARDRLFFRALAAVHPRFQSPANSLVVQGLLSTALLLFIGRFQQLFELAIFSEWLFYAITSTTLFVFRRREPGRERPFRVPGYPVTPLLFLVASVVLLGYSYIANLRGSLIGTAIILLGFPLFRYFRNRRASQPVS